MMTLQQKVALDEFSKFKLPRANEEYRQRYGADAITSTWLNSGVWAVQEMISTNILHLNREEKDADNLLKRWQEVSPALFEFLREATPGDIFYAKQYHPYAPGAPQQFRNTPLAEPLKLENGRTMVDIGFADFGVALDSIKTLNPSGEPLTIIGYDMSPLNTCLLLEYLHSKVKAILKFWKKVPRITKQAALDFQLKAVCMERTATHMMNACALESERDRVDYLRYAVTKALYEDEDAIIGSPIMGKNNDRVGVKQIFESCIEAAPSNVHDNSSCDSFMGRITLYFEASIQEFANHVRRGTLTFSPKYGTVSPDNVSLTQEIKKLNPVIIHWSNIVDYIPPHEFHTFAKEVSGSDTVHVVHSCNWTSRVYGQMCMISTLLYGFTFIAVA